MGCEETCYITLGVGAFVILLIVLVTCVVTCYVHKRQVAKYKRMMLLRAMLERTNASNVSSRRSSIAVAASRGYQAVSLFDLYTPPSTPPPSERNSDVT